MGGVSPRFASCRHFKAPGEADMHPLDSRRPFSTVSLQTAKCSSGLFRCAARPLPPSLPPGTTEHPLGDG